MPIWNKTVTRLIKIPYWIALSLIGLSVTAAFITTIYAIEAQRERLELADLAARQRLSSQRVPFLANEMMNATDEESRQLYRSELEKAVRNMEQRHDILSLHKHPERLPAGARSILRDVYYSPFRPFHVQMDRFLNNARAVLEADENQLRPDMPQLIKLKEMGAGSLLRAHGLVYTLLRREASAALKRFMWIAAALWSLTLAMIILEVPLIFRPMAGRTARSLRGLDAARRNAEEELAKEAEREDKIVYLRIVSHEMRTPLNGILGMIELLRMSGLPEKQAEYAERIEQAARQLLSIINHVLEFREIEADLVRLQMAPTSIVEAVETVVEEFRPSATEKELDLTLHVDSSLSGYYLTDGERIRQVLDQMIRNALKFTDKGGIAVRVRYAGALGTEADLVRFEVEDTGIGVPPVLKDHIFREWRQADDTLARKYGGTGLGLAIVRRLVELMNGEMGLESSEGEGSLFWFTLPLQRLPENAGFVDEPPPPSDGVKKAG